MIASAQIQFFIGRPIINSAFLCIFPNNFGDEISIIRKYRATFSQICHFRNLNVKLILNNSIVEVIRWESVVVPFRHQTFPFHLFFHLIRFLLSLLLKILEIICWNFFTVMEWSSYPIRRLPLISMIQVRRCFRASTHSSLSSWLKSVHVSVLALSSSLFKEHRDTKLERFIPWL